MSRAYWDTTMLKRLRAGEKLSAAWTQLGSNMSAEIFAEAGFDILVIDMEHGPFTLTSLISAAQATKGTDCVPFVRAPWNDLVWIKQILDAGIYGIHVPYVSTAKEAEYAVRACKYAPQGIRGIAGCHRAVNYGMNKADYYRHANQDVVVTVAIETPEGVDNAEAIAAVEGVDVVFIGPADLSTAMGYLADPSVPEVQEAIRKVEAAAQKQGKMYATVAPDMKAAKVLYDRGYSIIYTLSDTITLAQAAMQAIKEFREYAG